MMAARCTAPLEKPFLSLLEILLIAMEIIVMAAGLGSAVLLAVGKLERPNALARAAVRGARAILTVALAPLVLLHFLWRRASDPKWTLQASLDRLWRFAAPRR